MVSKGCASLFKKRSKKLCRVGFRVFSDTEGWLVQPHPMCLRGERGLIGAHELDRDRLCVCGGSSTPRVSTNQDEGTAHMKRARCSRHPLSIWQQAWDIRQAGRDSARSRAEHSPCVRAHVARLYIKVVRLKVVRLRGQHRQPQASGGGIHQYQASRRRMSPSAANKCDTRAAAGARRWQIRQCGRPWRPPPMPWDCVCS